MVGEVARTVPDPQQVLVPDIEAHRVLVSAGEVVEALELARTDFWVDQPNNVTAAAGAQVIDQLPGDVRNDIPDVFLLLPAADLTWSSQFLLHN